MHPDSSFRAVVVSSFVLLAACAAAPDPSPDNSTDAGSVADAGGASSGTEGTGAACTEDAVCAGESAKCLTTDGTGLVYPGGSCSASCRLSRNDAFNGANADCPGNATCVELNGRAGCFPPCEAGDCREGWTCTVSSAEAATGAPVCLPTSLTCDPDQPRSGCGASEVCMPGAGPDPYGVCAPSCDPFAPACAADRACYPLARDGTGVCVFGGTVPVGQQCTVATQCVPGALCVNTDRGPLCAALCGGSASRACPEGKTCSELDPSIPVSTVGYCK